METEREDVISVSSAQSLRSDATCASWISEGPGHRCYSGETLFRVSEVPRASPADGSEAEAEIALVPGSELKKGTWVRGIYNWLEVAAVYVHPSEQCELFRLHVEGEGPTLTVTGRHRIVTGAGRPARTARAEQLRPGDAILCSSPGGRVGLTTLAAVYRFATTADVVQVSFRPDEPVEAFDPPPGVILSKGQSPLRRGGAGRHRSRGDDVISIPDTEDSFR